MTNELKKNTTDKKICRCFHVFESEVIKLIDKKRTFNFEEVQDITSCSLGCGSCKKDILKLIENKQKDMISELQNIIQKVLGDSSITISEQDHLKHSVGVSSMDLLLIVDEVESYFDVTFLVEDYNEKNFNTVINLLELIKKRKVLKSNPTC